MSRRRRIIFSFFKILLICTNILFIASSIGFAEHPVPREHPRLFGNKTKQYLKDLAGEKPGEYKRLIRVAQKKKLDPSARFISKSLVSLIEDDSKMAREAIDGIMDIVNGPIRKGHTTFGHDLAWCALVYDLCYPYWTEDEKKKCHEYVNKTVDANVDSESHVFHNGWYGYKNWGIGLACYATYYENKRAPEILAALKKDYNERAVPALNMAGEGGGWAEGLYLNYFLYYWVFFCEVAYNCEGIDLYKPAHKFFNYRTIASIFETYPGIAEYGSRSIVPMGDGWVGSPRAFCGYRDTMLNTRRILVKRFKDDPAHQAVHTFNELTPRSSVSNYAYMDFLWRKEGIKKGSLNDFRLSYISTGPGHVYARSSWKDDATYFYFKCGDRFTSHQHLDNGHFLIYKYNELAGDGGHYDSFATPHAVNYFIRTIAHNTILIHNPEEVFKGIRSDRSKIMANDGGQTHDWPHHNGAVRDVDAWEKDKELYDIADMIAFEDREKYVYVAGDCTRSYSSEKMGYFTRQIIYLRPGTFIIFDRVKSKKASFRKTWLLQAMINPEKKDGFIVITNGKGKLFIQPLLPQKRKTRLILGEDLYLVNGKLYEQSQNRGKAPECRIEISPSKESKIDYFLNVLTAAESGVNSVRKAVVKENKNSITVLLDDIKVVFNKDSVAGRIRIKNQEDKLAQSIIDNINGD